MHQEHAPADPSVAAEKRNKQNDWSWCNHGSTPVEDEDHGFGTRQTMLCMGALVCKKWKRAQRAPTSKSAKVKQAWLAKGVYKHKGFHLHGRVSHNKPLPSRLAELKQIVTAKPHVKARGLAMGRAKGPDKVSTKIKAARYIDSALIHKGRTC
ncbi:hypothetical protein V8E36_007490 [Tilletia maclaganii]